MRNPQYRQIRAITVTAVIATMVSTGVAFWLSYEHLHDVARANGLSGARAWAWPAAIDLFIVIGELLVLRASLLKRKDLCAFLVVAGGSIGSVALNVAGVGEHAGALEYVVAAVPPVGALVAFGVIMRQVHEHLQGAQVQPAGAPDKIRVPAPVSAPEYELAPVLAEEPQAMPSAPASAPALVPAQEQVHPEPHLSLVPAARPESAPVPEVYEQAPSAPVKEAARVHPQEEDDVLVARVREEYGGTLPSLRELKSKYSIGQVRAQRVRAALAG